VKKAMVSPGTVWATAGLAAALWFVTFHPGFCIFWIKIGFSAALLAAFALWRDPPAARPRLDVASVVKAVVSAVALWGIFWVGKQVSTLILPFAEGQIGAIYGKGEGFSPAVIFFLLLLVTGPCEEIYWRGFLQKHLMGRYGHLKGWLAASAVYALVHIWSFNFMLIGAAAVAGAFWGLCYWRWGRLTPVVISHSLWSAVVFSLAPIP
jgi:membrane protease YdiL (CAAX protease family)